MITARELSEKRLKLADDARKILEVAHKENRHMTPEEDSKWQAIHKDIDAAKAEFDRISQQERVDRELGELKESRNEKGIGRETAQPASEASTAKKTEITAMKRFLLTNQASEEIRRVGMEGLPAEFRSLSQITGASGQYTIPQGFYAEIQTKLKSIAGPRNAPCNVFETEIGNDLPVPIGDDTGNQGELLTENNVSNSTTDPTFSQGLIHQYVFSSKIVLVPVPLLTDNGVNLDSWLTEQLAVRIGRAEGPYLTSGTGTSQPYGILNGVTNNYTGKASEYVAGGELTYNDILNTFHKVDPAYRDDPSFSWMMHDTTLQAVKAVVDLNGRPLWQPIMSSSFRDAMPDTILGKRVYLNQFMSPFQNQSVVMLVGAMRYFFIRTVSNAQFLVLRERYADAFQVGFVYFQRTGSYNTVPQGFATFTSD